MKSSNHIPTLSVVRLPELIDELAAGSLLAYSDAHQIACCRALKGIGFGDISLNQIEKYLDSAQNWSRNLQSLIKGLECQLFFPNLGISMQNISHLAHFHDSNRCRPGSVRRTVNLLESREKFLLARQQNRQLKAKLSIQSYWIDTAHLPLTEKTLERLYQIQQRGGTTELMEKRLQSCLWLTQFLRNNNALESQLACGNIRKLTILVEQVLQFARCREFKSALGEEFDGLNSKWNELQQNQIFFSNVQSVLKVSGLDHEVMANWTKYEAPFFSLCRKASKVRRRLQKLNGLVKRQYCTPAESTGYMAVAQKSISRLQIWITVLKASQNSIAKYPEIHCNLTPQQLLEKLTSR